MTQQATDLLTGVNTASDMNPENMSGLEKKHVPFIDCPDSVNAGETFECTIQVGKFLEHPNEVGHFIRFIDLYLDEDYLGRADFQTTKANPKVTFSIQLKQGGTLKAYENCNLHGVWRWDKEINVM